jgi:hypothetical protein
MVSIITTQECKVILHKYYLAIFSNRQIHHLLPATNLVKYIESKGNKWEQEANNILAISRMITILLVIRYNVP